MAKIEEGWDPVPEYKGQPKYRCAWAFTWENVAKRLGLEDEVIGVYIDPSREIIRFITRDPKIQVPEGQEMPEMSKDWPTLVLETEQEK